MATAVHPRVDRQSAAASASWLADWWAGTAEAETWLSLAWYDIQLRYRRSILGPWWLTISMGMMLLGIGPLYALLFRAPMNTYFPHVAIGMIVWSFVSGTFLDGCGVFIGATGYLKNSDMPLTLFVWRCVARQVIQLLHHLLLYLPIAAMMGVTVTAATALALPGLLLLVFNMHVAVIFLGIACARFRDVAQIVGSLMTFMTYLTPIIWTPDLLPDSARLLLDLPFAAWLTVVREPLLGRAPGLHPWGVAIGWTAVNVAIAAAAFAWKRRQVVYWV